MIAIWEKWVDYRENKLLQEHAPYKYPQAFELGEEYLLEQSNKHDFIKFIEQLENSSENFFHVPDSIPLKNFILSEEGKLLKFSSLFQSKHIENNTCYADYYPAKSDTAIVIIPHWNSFRSKYTSLCKFIQKIGNAALCVSLPYHEERNHEKTPISNFLLSSNIGRTIQSLRQGAVDTRCAIDWLVEQGYSNIILLGVSIGTPVAMIVAAHDARIKGSIISLTSSDFAEAVWTGQSTKHIRIALENKVTLDELKKYWAVLSPKTYVKKLRNNQHHMIIYGERDKTMLPYLAEELFEEYNKFNLPCKLVKLSCGHYTIRDFPFKYQFAWNIKKFLDNIK
ncbi:hypothetical protein HZA55_02535 [Candidatus Poribacteria bacterium]|nr:hypothetical protein [Candidatus Poribacteria bacterium]